MRKNSFILHLLLFIGIEIVFVFLLFRELPETNLMTLIGVLHTSYRAVLVLAGRIREKRATKRRHKFSATYLPILYHVFIHVYATLFAVQQQVNELHHEHELQRIVAGSLLLGVLIFWGEWLLHKKYHCDHHHHKVHKYCKEA